MTESTLQHCDCPFCGLHEDIIVARNDLAVALRDTTPVTHLHTLVVPIRHTETYFDLSPDELNATNELLRRLREAILADDATVTGFNLGANVGLDAGQTILHCHVHLIPRRHGDVRDPKGGVRGVIPEKMRY